MSKFTAALKRFWDGVKKFFTGAYYFVRNVSRMVVRAFRGDAGYGAKRVGRVFGRVLGVFARVLLAIFLIVFTTGAILTVFGAIYITHYLEVDNQIDLSTIEQAETSHIFARDPDNPGQWVEIHSMSVENRIWVSFDEIPGNMINCVVAMEDKRFWEHQGVDWKRTIAAFANMFLGLREEGFGGSTITQQLIKVRTGNDEVSVSRKLQEIFTALELESKYSKEVIMEWYLNIIYLGSGCHGIKTAAMTYFGKGLDELTLAECASIAGITNNPSVYDPYISPKNNKIRQERILQELYDQQIISEAEFNEAMAQELVFVRSAQDGSSSGKVMNWYVEQVIRDVRADYMKKMNCTEVVAQIAMSTGGWNIYSCVDLRAQEILDGIWADDACWPSTPDAEPPESSMVIMDNETGEIRALIGGREKVGDMVNSLATMSKRQPGSSLKPLSVYAPAFELGVVTPYSVIDDAPVAKMDNRAWPRNSPTRYEGLMTVMKGVTLSKNTVSIRTLNMVDDTYRRSFDFVRERFGVTTLVESKTVGGQILSDVQASPLAFGALTNGVTVREMCAAYCSFPNRGVYKPGITYTEVRSMSGELIFENPAEKHIAVKEKTAYYMTACLYSAVNTSGGTGTSARIPNMPTAGKTGTTSANKDRWFAGYTPYYTAVCWFGYVIGRDMSYYNNTGVGNPAVHMWKQVMTKLHEGLEYKDFPQPAGLVQAQYCIDSGMAPSEWCPLDVRGSRVATGLFDKDDVPRQVCDRHIPVEIDIASGHPATPYCPQETRQTKAALAELFRIMPVDGIDLPDEQYVMHKWGEYAYYFVPEEWFPAYGLGTDGKKPFRDWCEFHLTPSDADTGDPGDDDGDTGDTGDPFNFYWDLPPGNENTPPPDSYGTLPGDDPRASPPDGGIAPVAGPW